LKEIFDGAPESIEYFSKALYEYNYKKAEEIETYCREQNIIFPSNIHQLRALIFNS
jgi:hypothetical protein